MEDILKLKNVGSYYHLTEEDVKAACSYLPTTLKMHFIRRVADKCFDTLDITANNGNEATKTLPSCYKINTDKKARYLMGAFVKLYLSKDFEPEKEDDPWLMSVCDYDFYAGGHIFEAMNRMKSNIELRDKCFDLLSDYSELKFRLESDIKGLLQALNDPASRILTYIEAVASPAELQNAIRDMEENQAILQEYVRTRRENLEAEIAANAGESENAEN